MSGDLKSEPGARDLTTSPEMQPYPHLMMAAMRGTNPEPIKVMRLVVEIL